MVWNIHLGVPRFTVLGSLFHTLCSRPVVSISLPWVYCLMFSMSRMWCHRIAVCISEYDSMNKTSLGLKIAEELSRIVSKGRNSWECHRSPRFTLLIFIVINWIVYFISRYDILWDIGLELYLSICLLPSWRMIRYCCCNFGCSTAVLS